LEFSRLFFRAQRNVADKFAVQPIFDLACSYLCTFDLAGQWRSVDADGHRNGWIFNGDLWQRFWVVRIGQCIANHDVFDTGYSHGYTGTWRVCWDSVEDSSFQQFGNFDVLDT